MLRYVDEGRLGHPIQHDLLVIAQFLDPGKAREADPQAGSLRKSIQIGMQRGNEPQVVKDGWTQVAGKLMDDVHRFFDKALRSANVPRESLLADAELGFEGGEYDVDSRESLGDFIMKLAADL